ncbi:MAG: PfkB family carbohydrate kinase [Anaerolineales bacterium]
MSRPEHDPALDTLVIGHVSADREGSHIRLGGTAAYAGLTAHALGRHVGVVTSAGRELDLSALAGLSVMVIPSATSTVFENRETEHGRRQTLLSRAAAIPYEAVPAAWRRAGLVHLAPIAAELDTEIVNSFPGSFLGLTAQGWLRSWGPDGTVIPSGLTHALPACARADAVVVSLEDLGGREGDVLELAARCRLLAVTLGQNGVRVFTRGSEHHLPAPPATEIDPTGAGDIFAAAFFHSLRTGAEPREAARFAQQFAAPSVSRRGLAAVPSAEEARRSPHPVPP